MHPELARVGNFTIYAYGVFAAAGMLVALWLAQRRAPEYGVSRSQAADLVFFVFVSGVVGARIFFVAQHWEDYRQSLAQIFFFREGGLVWYGGFVFAVTAGALYAGVRKWPILNLFDFAAPIIPIAHAIGRLGCFFNGCCIGAETAGAFGFRLPGESMARWPVQIYEAVLLVALSLALSALRGRRRPEGSLFLLYILGYSFLRFLLEFFRGDQELYQGLTIPQWTSAALFAASLLLLKIISRKPGKHA